MDKITRKTFLMMMAVLTIMTLNLQAQTESAPATNLEVIQKIYTSLDSGDLPTVLALMDENMVWNEAEHFPYADGNPYIGPDAVAEGVFSRLGSDWEYFNIADREFHKVDDNMVLVTARYQAKNRSTGRNIDAQAVHLWTLKDGKVIQFQQYVDTYQVQQAMHTE